MNPDYYKIYKDILVKKYPHKIDECKNILEKKKLSALDILSLNQKIFGKMNEEMIMTNQKYRAYRRSDVLQILNYQKKYNLNNSQLARHFKMSRNTIGKWKKLFLVN